MDELSKKEMIRNHKRFPWPSEYYKNTGYCYPWFIEQCKHEPKFRNIILNK